MKGPSGDIFAQIAEVIGLPAAVRLADVRGGGRMTVPARVSENHWLTQLIGRQAADKLCAHFRTLSPEGSERGVEIDMPRGPTGTVAHARRRMVEELEKGKSADAAARISGMTRRTAYRLKRRRRDDDKSPRLL